MFAKEILVSTVLVAAFLQVTADGDSVPNTSNGLTRLATSSMTGMTNVLDSGAHAAASGVDLTATSLTHGIKAVGGAADVANNVQKVKFDFLKQARDAAGLFGTSLSNLSSAALSGALRRGAEAVEASQRATEFVLGESDRIRGAGKKVAKSLVSNTSGSLVNGLNGIDKVVTSGGEVREEVADTAGAIHDAGTELVKEGVRTWKDMGLASIGSIRKGLQEARKRTIGGTPQTVDTSAKTPTNYAADTITPTSKDEPPKTGGGWFGWRK